MMTPMQWEPFPTARRMWRGRVNGQIVAVACDSTPPNGRPRFGWALTRFREDAAGCASLDEAQQAAERAYWRRMEPQTVLDAVAS